MNGLKQIVEKAAVSLKGGLSEVKLDLKPEFLGRVMMRISIENHQVQIRILAELPLVKQMIEGNINQLKADLQNHGLEIEKFDVTLAEDSDKKGTDYDASGFQKMKKGSRDRNHPDNGPDRESEESNPMENERSPVNVVNFFA